MAKTRELVCCEFCGRDTRNVSKVCRHCSGGNSQSREHAAAAMSPWSMWENEDCDFSANAFGPKQAEDRYGAVWSDSGMEWKKTPDQR